MTNPTLLRHLRYPTQVCTMQLHRSQLTLSFAISNLGMNYAIAYMMQVINQLKESGCGIKIVDTLLRCLLYADDLLLTAESKADLQVLLNVVNKGCEMET